LVDQDQNPQSEENVVQEDEAPRQPSPKVQRPNSGGVLVVGRDPGLCCQIWEYPVDKQDESSQNIHKYMMHGPYQFLKDEYPLSGSQKHQRRFQAHWFKSKRLHDSLYREGDCHYVHDRFNHP